MSLNLKKLLTLSFVFLWLTILLASGIWFIEPKLFYYVLGGGMVLNALGSIVLFFIEIFTNKSKS